jgi:cardiolipin synthase
MMSRLPNVLTFSRIAAIPIVIGLLFIGTDVGNWVALGVYTAACVTDFLDGYLARAWEQQSSLGRFLDPIADKLFVAAIILVLVGIDRITGIALLPAVVILCREILVSGLREFLAEVRVGVPVNRLAKWKTTIQMVAIGFLVTADAGPDFGPLTTIEIGLYGLWAAALLTLVTGFDYLRVGLKHIQNADAQENKPAAEKSARDTG